MATRLIIQGQGGGAERPNTAGTYGPIKKGLWVHGERLCALYRQTGGWAGKCQ